MLAIDIVLSGLILGGTYALVAIGLTLQYGVARIMNLAYGELLVAAAFGACWLFTANAVSPIAGLVVIVPAAFAVNWLIYTLLLTPLVRRAKNRAMRWKPTASSPPSACSSSCRESCSSSSAASITATAISSRR